MLPACLHQSDVPKSNYRRTRRERQERRQRQKSLIEEQETIHKETPPGKTKSEHQENNTYENNTNIAIIQNSDSSVSPYSTISSSSSISPYSTISSTSSSGSTFSRNGLSQTQISIVSSDSINNNNENNMHTNTNSSNHLHTGQSKTDGDNISLASTVSSLSACSSVATSESSTLSDSAKRQSVSSLSDLEHLGEFTKQFIFEY